MANFRNILIISENTDTSFAVVEKAKELCKNADTKIHLVRIVRRRSLALSVVNLFTGKFYVGTLNQRRHEREYLNRLKNRIRVKDSSFKIMSTIRLRKGGTGCLQKYIREENIDIVIVADNYNIEQSHVIKDCFYTKLAGSIGIPFLGFFKDENGFAVKSILLNITASFPEQNILAAAELAKQYGAHIHIITILNERETETKKQVDTFYLAYKLLSEYGHRPQYKIISGKEKASILLGYAKHIKAGVMFLNANAETNIINIIKRKISQILNPLAGIQVLTVKPCFS